MKDIKKDFGHHRRGAAGGRDATQGLAWVSTPEFCTAVLDDAPFSSPDDGFGSGVNLQPVVEGTYVVAYGLSGNTQLVSDGIVAFTLGEKFKHLPLVLGEVDARTWP